MPLNRAKVKLNKTFLTDRKKSAVFEPERVTSALSAFSWIFCELTLLLLGLFKTSRYFITQDIQDIT